MRLRVLALEPYYGGSHKAVLDCLTHGLDVEWTVLTLPARKWKWRMRGSAITMASEARLRADALACASGEKTHVETHGGKEPCRAAGPWDVIFASTFVNLAEFRGLAGPDISSIPTIVYFHENQLVYPNRHTAEWDFQFPLTNITSALSAEKCVFNTAWNRERFLDEIPAFLRRFPDHQPHGIVEAIDRKSIVLSPPFDPAAFDEALGPSQTSGAPRASVPLVCWPHRWEHDKDPDAFVEAVQRLAEEGLGFEVAIAGQVFQDRPASIDRAVSLLGDRLVHIGEPASREDYARLLARSDIAVSTAINEFFGIAMIEAAYAGAYPLVPDRLAYPELYPEEMRYHDVDELVERLRALIQRPPPPGAGRSIAEAFTDDRLAGRYERLFREVAGVQE